jgi:hypothetical protein
MDQWKISSTQSKPRHANFRETSANWRGSSLKWKHSDIACFHIQQRGNAHLVRTHQWNVPHDCGPLFHEFEMHWLFVCWQWHGEMVMVLKVNGDDNAGDLASHCTSLIRLQNNLVIDNVRITQAWMTSDSRNHGFGHAETSNSLFIQMAENYEMADRIALFICVIEFWAIKSEITEVLSHQTPLTLDHLSSIEPFHKQETTK